MLCNNESAFDNHVFVDQAIIYLLKGGLIKEVSNRPHVVNPLTVSINSKNKERLILDIRHVNKQVLLNKFKFEDGRTLKQYVTPDSFGFVFDLKSGYHHIDINDSYQTYLGFSWKIDNIVKYFVFTVLPLGIRSSAYIFFKASKAFSKILETTEYKNSFIFR